MSESGLSSEEDVKDAAVSREELAVYIQGALVPESAAPIVATTPLISSGLLDSYSVLELITHVEERFDIEIDPCWHRLEHFDTIERIAQTIDTIRRQRRSG